MRLVFAGTPEVALPPLEALLASEHEVVAVVTRPDAPSGRGRKLTPSPVGQRAAELGLEVLKPAKPSDEAFKARLAELAPDLCPVVAYGGLLPQSVLDIPRLGWVNLHFSLLPRWRGAAPVQRAIMAGDEETGTACFRIVKELDAGDVYRMESQPMPDATAGEVLAHLSESGAAQLVETVDAIAAGEEPVAQESEGITLAPKITVEEARLDFGRSAAELRNQVMGCSPDPGAWCELDGERLKIYRAAVVDDATALAPGELLLRKNRVLLGTGDGLLELQEVQAAGKKRMTAADWARGGHSGAVLS
ncbi:methionyl-tRNA formyltransferase [Tessaracoccus rhinocerotis]|uniref:Methionyl-tRNA formyltransferase n=1 Tax=Tessaracoccus rhinocerotis TaxID=1689449 RepID=A0A553JY19_9ACTN|nr:methionyl-tRNA formyltransferase [Tessaracoccus rhinocerotis]TRY17340.1 methionyl-tRNA formyltransferase [Tessaracoccus rhinocerotis]